MEIDYPWVAHDLDAAAAALGAHVQGAYEEELDRRREASKESLTAEDRDAIWERVFHREVRGVIRIRQRVAVVEEGAGHRGKGTIVGGGVVRVVEKPITGDPNVDNRPTVGARRVLDERGRLLREYDAQGKRVR